MTKKTFSSKMAFFRRNVVKNFAIKFGLRQGIFTFSNFDSSLRMAFSVIPSSSFIYRFVSSIILMSVLYFCSYNSIFTGVRNHKFKWNIKYRQRENEYDKKKTCKSEKIVRVPRFGLSYFIFSY